LCVSFHVILATLLFCSCNPLQGVCLLAYVIGMCSLTLMCASLNNSCAEYRSSDFWCPQQLYRPSNLCCLPKLMRSPSNRPIWVRNHLQSLGIKIGRASCPMQSSGTKPVTRQTSGNSRVIFFWGEKHSRVTWFVTREYIYQLGR